VKRNPPLSPVRLDALEDRLTPSSVAAVRQAAGATAADVTAARDQFRADLGGGTVPGANGSFGGLRREINWDGVPDAKSAPNPLPGDFFNTTSPRGAVFQAVGGSGFQVSSTAASGVPVRFGNIDPSYTADLGVFSPQRIFTPIGTTVTDVTFFVPGTNTFAVTNGFGAVFTDVDKAGTAQMEFFDARGRVLAVEAVPPALGAATFSFLGVTFTDACVARVRITAGTSPLAAGTLDNPVGGGADVAAMDDFIYGEPVRPVDRVVLAGAGEGALAQVATLRADGTAAGTVTPLGGFAGGARVAAADVTGDGILDTVLGTGPGVPAAVRVVDGRTGATLFDTVAFEPSFTGGAFVAAGDLTGDGFAEVVVAPDQGGGPRVRVFDGKTFAPLADFFGIDDVNFRGGARPAVADVTGDGRGDLLVAAGFGGGPRLAGFEGKSVAAGAPVKPFADFFVFENTLRNGVYLAGGDLNGDGFADVIAGGGPGGGPRVYAVDGKSLVQTGARVQAANFFASDDVNNRGGVRVAARDLDADGRADIITGDGPGSGARVRVFGTATLSADGRPAELFEADPFAGATNGVYVG
jgi:hypothetical protein